MIDVILKIVQKTVDKLNSEGATLKAVKHGGFVFVDDIKLKGSLVVICVESYANRILSVSVNGRRDTMKSDVFIKKIEEIVLLAKL